MPKGPERVAVKIDRREWTGWEQVEIQRHLDNFATVAFSSVFEPERREFRDTFRPFTFKPLDVDVGGAPLFTGTMVSVQPATEPASKTVECNGYSKPGVLDDAYEPVTEFPLEFRGLTLRQIAERLCSPLGVHVRVEGDDGPPFKRVALKEDQKPKGFLTDLAQQRGLILGDDEAGSLVFLRSSRPGRPVARLAEGMAPTVSVAATFNPQDYYSEITGIARTRPGRGGSTYTEANPRLPGVVRPLTFTTRDVQAQDLPEAVRARVGRMFGNVASYVVNGLPTWRDDAGILWAPNTTVTLHAPGAMVYTETEFLVRDVILNGTASEVTANLGLVFPGAFSGEAPPRLPWEE
jgi:prophage tail gpP-like protein